MSLFTWLKIKLNKTPKEKRNSTKDLITFHFEDQEIANNETVYAAIDFISNSMASAPIYLYCNHQKIDVTKNRLAYLLKFGPNSFQTQFEFIKLVETLRKRYGAAYVLKEYDSAGEISALYVIENDAIEPILEASTKELFYQVNTNEGRYFIHNSHILAFNGVTMNGYTPISPLDVLKNTITYDKEVKEFSINQMKDGLNCKVAISIDSDINPNDDVYKTYIKNFKKNGVLYLSRGQQAQSLNTGSPIDPKVFEAEEITVAKVARVIGVPPEKLRLKGEKEEDKEGIKYLKDFILPNARLYEQTLTNGLLTMAQRKAGYEIKLGLNGFMRADTQVRGEFYFKGLRSGWFTVDDIRRLEDLEPFNETWSTTPLVSRDLMPLSSVLMSEMEGGVNNGTE